MELTLYKQAHGNLFVPVRYTKKGNLGRFVDYIHRRRRGAAPRYAPLSVHVIAALDDLRFVWNVRCTRH